jgi:hypothetical protein
LLWNYHCGMAKFDVKIFDGTQCQKKYAPITQFFRIKDLYVIAYV